MRKTKGMRRLGTKLASAFMSGVLAFGLMPSFAFAAQGEADMSLSASGAALSVQEDAMSADGYVIAAAYAAAEPAPEILGLNNPNFRNTGEADNIYPMFGDPEVNENASPYVYNYKNNLTPGIAIGGRGGGPMAALNAYDTTDTTAAQNAVWAYTPHIVLGTGADAIPANEHDFYIERDGDTVAQALGLESYQPIGVTYNRVDLPAMIGTMYRLANAAEEVLAADDTLKTRYEDPLEIAKDYERYILGQKGLVKKAIDTGKVEKRTIANVQSYDSDAKTYTLITEGVAEGTAATNRFLEAVQGVTYNYYDTAGATVTADQLKENVDVILVGGQASFDSTALAGYLATDGLLDRTFYCTSMGVGAVFGVTVNSVENAQNIGRILPCVYPEVLDQSDMVAYYYDTFYHIKDGKIADMVAEKMDGVRNWDNTDSASYLTWDASDVSGYNHDAIKAKLVEGVGYLNTQTGLTAYLQPTSNLASDVAVIDLADAAITVNAAVGPANPTELTVTYGDRTLVEGTDYTAAYEKTSDAAGTVTITAVEGGACTGTKTATYAIEPIDISGAGVKKFDDEYAYTGSAISIEPSVTVNDVKLVQGTDFEVTVEQNGAAAEFKEIGTYDVTITGIGAYTGTISKQIKVVPYFTVYKKVGDGEAEAVKTYTAEEFAALKSDSADPVSALFFKDDVWQVATAATYVTLEDLLEDAGIAEAWAAGASLSYAGGTFTYEQLQASSKFFPDAQQATSGTATAAKAAPFVLSLTEYSAKTDASSNAAAVEAANVAAANGKNTPRSIFGVSDEDYAAKSAAGRRLWSGLTSVTIEVPAQEQPVVKTNIAVPTAKTLTYNGKAQIGVAAGTGYTVTGNSATNAGTYTATATLSDPATTQWADGTTAAKAIKWTINPAAPTITAKDASVAMGKTASLGATVNSGAALTYATSNAKVAKVNASGKVTPVKAGSVTITIKAAAKGNYAAASKTVKVTVKQGKQTVTFKKATKNVKLKKVKKAKQTVAIAKAKAKTAVTYAISKVAKAKYKKNFTINKKTGKITVKKGTPKGTYKVTVKATAKKTADWAKAAKTAVITIKVK